MGLTAPVPIVVLILIVATMVRRLPVVTTLPASRAATVAISPVLLPVARSLQLTSSSTSMMSANDGPEVWVAVPLAG